MHLRPDGLVCVEPEIVDQIEVCSREIWHMDAHVERFTLPVGAVHDQPEL